MRLDIAPFKIEKYSIGSKGSLKISLGMHCPNEYQYLLPQRMKRSIKSLGIIQVFVCIGALPAGVLMMIFPDGSGLGIPPGLLTGSPFTDYFIPGVFLLLLNGLFQMAGAVLTFKKSQWAGKAGACLGILLMFWICIQVYFIGLVSFLQPFYFLLGLSESLLGLKLVNMQKHGR